MPRIKTGIKIALITIFAILIVYYLQKYGIEPLKEAVQSMGIWAPLGIAFLRGISIVLPAFQARFTPYSLARYWDLKPVISQLFSPISCFATQHFSLPEFGDARP